MKRHLLTVIFLSCFASGYAQQDTTSSDSVKNAKKVKLEVNVGTDKDKGHGKGESKFSAGFTLSRFDLGLSRYLDHGSFTLSPDNDFLDFEGWKTINVGFEFFQLGYRVNNNFKIYLATGVDWTHIRLKQNISFLKDQPVLTPVHDSVNFSKNRLSSQYLRVPLSFQFRTNADHKGERFYFVAGPELGFLVGGKQKQISTERGKVKIKDDFSFQPVRYGAFFRMGYSNIGVYAKYYFSDVFADKQGPTDFKNIAFGLTFGF